MPECDDKWTDNSKGHSDLGSGLRVLVIPPKPAEVLCEENLGWVLDEKITTVGGIQRPDTSRKGWAAQRQ